MYSLARAFGVENVEVEEGSDEKLDILAWPWGYKKFLHAQLNWA